MTAQLSLPACVLPGCQTPVSEWGEPCAGCVDAFGPMLKRVDGGLQITEEQIAARDSETAAAYVAQARLELSPAAKPDEPERKPMQLCWLCEQRRTCTAVSGRWECDGCREVSA